jgi:hypothetical protein
MDIPLQILKACQVQYDQYLFRRDNPSLSKQNRRSRRMLFNHLPVLNACSEKIPVPIMTRCGYLHDLFHILSIDNYIRLHQAMHKPAAVVSHLYFA